MHELAEYSRTGFDHDAEAMVVFLLHETTRISLAVSLVELVGVCLFSSSLGLSSFDVVVFPFDFSRCHLRRFPSWIGRQVAARRRRCFLEIPYQNSLLQIDLHRLDWNS